MGETACLRRPFIVHPQALLRSRASEPTVNYASQFAGKSCCRRDRIGRNLLNIEANVVHAHCDAPLSAVGTMARMIVPCIGRDSMDRVPLSRLMRSRILINP